MINRRTPKPENFDELEKGRCRTRKKIDDHLVLFFPNDTKSVSVKYKADLIKNYNGMTYEQAVTQHFLTIAAFRAELEAAEELYQKIKADGHEHISPM